MEASVFYVLLFMLETEVLLVDNKIDITEAKF